MKSTLGAFGSSSKSSSTKPVLGSFGSPSKSSSKPTLGSSDSSRSPSFIPATSSKKSYETVSYNPKTGKQSTSLGIIWIPTKRRNKKKDIVFSSMNYDKKISDRSPSMYSYHRMSGDSPVFQLHKKKEEESEVLMPDRLKAPIATMATAGTVATVIENHSEESTDSEEKLLKHDDDRKEENDNKEKDKDYLDNSDVSEHTADSKNNKSSDKVDSVYSPSAPIKPPLQPEPTTWEEEDCGIKCLYYMMQCCECVLM